MKTRRLWFLVIMLLVLAGLAYVPEKKVEAVEPACTSQHLDCQQSCHERGGDNV
jgi:hypothetical protein